MDIDEKGQNMTFSNDCFTYKVLQILILFSVFPMAFVEIFFNIANIGRRHIIGALPDMKPNQKWFTAISFQTDNT